MNALLAADSAVPADVWLLLLLGALVVLLWIRARMHRRPMTDIARELGLSGGSLPRARLRRRFAGLGVLQCGHSQRVVDVLSGETECGRLTCFRLINELGSRSTRTVRQWVVAVIEAKSCVRHLHLAGDAVHTQCLPPGVSAVGTADSAVPDQAVRDQSAGGIYAAAPDRSRLPLETLNAWIAEHGQFGQWQITPHYVAGFRAYPRRSEPIRQLILSTLSLCQVLQGTALPAGAEAR